MLVATRGGPTMLARIGVMRALNGQVVREFNSDCKETHWGKRDRLTLTAVKAALGFVAIVVFLLLLVRAGLRHFKSASPRRL